MARTEQVSYFSRTRFVTFLYFCLSAQSIRLLLIHMQKDPQNKKLPSPYTALTDLFVCRTRLRSP